MKEIHEIEEILSVSSSSQENQAWIFFDFNQAPEEAKNIGFRDETGAGEDPTGETQLMVRKKKFRAGTSDATTSLSIAVSLTLNILLRFSSFENNTGRAYGWTGERTLPLTLMRSLI